MWEKTGNAVNYKSNWGNWIWEKIIRERVIHIFTHRNKIINK